MSEVFGDSLIEQPLGEFGVGDLLVPYAAAGGPVSAAAMSMSVTAAGPVTSRISPLLPPSARTAAATAALSSRVRWPMRPSRLLLGRTQSGSPADKATASSSTGATATTAPPADAEAIRACMTGVDSLFTADWSKTTPPKTRPPGCESLSVTEYGYAYRSAMAAIAQDGEDFYNENDGLPSDWPS
ncbi:hypothetical protein ABZ137_41340 [Streptomyces bobili]|uniref:hypothetical protein n=1 Tax=Streptomyces bobili TaxID=67280 RepID=UPI0033B4BA01